MVITIVFDWDLKQQSNKQAINRAKYHEQMTYDRTIVGASMTLWLLACLTHLESLVQGLVTSLVHSFFHPISENLHHSLLHHL